MIEKLDDLRKKGILSEAGIPTEEGGIAGKDVAPLGTKERKKGCSV